MRLIYEYKDLKFILLIFTTKNGYSEKYVPRQIYILIPIFSIMLRRTFFSIFYGSKTKFNLTKCKIFFVLDKTLNTGILVTFS